MKSEPWDSEPFHFSGSFGKRLSLYQAEAGAETSLDIFERKTFMH
jgi:hypothetical protein